MIQPKISVVTVCYNAVNDIEKTILSVINLAKTFDGPPTLERSGSEHREGRFPSSRLRREDRDERWSLL